MLNIDAIRLARTLGLGNVAELNKFKKLVIATIKDSNNVPAKVEAKLSLTPEQIESIQRICIGHFNVADVPVPNTMQVLRQYTPRYYTPGNKLDILVGVEKFGPRSGRIAISSEDSLGTVANKIQVVGNESYIRIEGTGKSELGESSFDGTFTTDGGTPDMLLLLKNIIVKQIGDKLKLTIPETKTGALTIQVDSTVNAQAVNKMIEERTGGVHKSWADIINSLASHINKEGHRKEHFPVSNPLLTREVPVYEPLAPNNTGGLIDVRINPVTARNLLRNN